MGGFSAVEKRFLALFQGAGKGIVPAALQCEKSDLSDIAKHSIYDWCLRLAACQGEAHLEALAGSKASETFFVILSDDGWFLGGGKFFIIRADDGRTAHD